MKFGIVIFPGSNCDHDCEHVLSDVLKQKVKMLWHKEHSLEDVDCVVLPGGFSYGDYLRTGAVARFSPIMKEVIQFAHKGGLVIGICNGFQILLEVGLLPGAMLRNRSLQFVCKFVHLRVENTDTPFTNACGENVGARPFDGAQGKRAMPLRIPIAHGEGNYFADTATLKRLKENNQVLFRYCDGQGQITDAANPNGSLENIAGICNEQGNVLGMMPHPERASEVELESVDGKKIFESLLS
jgi:phosphoribosylformylglycinamidine synthase